MEKEIIEIFKNHESGMSTKNLGGIQYVARSEYKIVAVEIKKLFKKD